MKIKQADKSQLIIEDFPLFPGIIMLPAAILLFVKIIQRLLKEPSFDIEMLGLIIGFLAFLLGTALFNEHSLFVFNIYQRKLFWKRTSLFGKKEGMIPFNNIKNVVLQASSSESVLTYRLAIITEDKTIPFTRYYDAGKKNNCETIRNAVLTLMGKDTSRFIEDSILEMAASGQKIEAIKLAQEHYKMNTKQAKEFIETLLK